MPEKVSITKTKLDNLANAISAKSGEPLNLTIDEMEAAVNGINIGEENVLEGVKVNGVELPIDSQKKVNIPVVSENKAGVMTPSIMNEIYNRVDYVIDNKADKSEIPNKVSQLTNDEGYISTETDPTVPSWAKESTKPTYTAAEVGALPDTTVITDEKLKVDNNISSSTNYYPILTTNSTEASTKTRSGGLMYTRDSTNDTLTIGDFSPTINRLGALAFQGGTSYRVTLKASSISGPNKIITIPNKTGTMALTDDIPSVPSWALESDKPTYTAQEVGALPNTTTYVSSFNGSTGNITYTAPVTSVNNQTGNVNLSIPDSTSDLTNDSGFITNSEEDDPVFTASAAYGIQSSDITNWNNKSDFSGNYNDLTNKPTIPTVPTNVSAFTNDAGYITGYTETDPVFSASPAAGITSSDITSWNNKVSDDKTWNGVTLSKTQSTSTNTKYIPTTTNTTDTSMSYTRTQMNGVSIQGGNIPQYDTNGYLYVETPDENAGFRTVANKSYVDSKIPSQFVSNIGYNTVLKEIYMTRNSANVTIVTTATLKSDMAYSSSNTTGFLTMADLPIYDGVVE